MADAAGCPKPLTVAKHASCACRLRLAHFNCRAQSSVCRNAFGNNPDTSKALRFLVAENRIVRTGAGGRKDPYSYVVR